MSFLHFLLKAIKGSNKFAILSLVLAISLMACSKRPSLSELEKQFARTVPVEDINKSLILVLDSKDTSFQSGSRIEMQIYNKSPHHLYFDTHTHMQLLASPDLLQWIEVENGFTYAASPMILSPAGTPLLDDQHQWAIPILDQSLFDNGNSEIPIRIVVVGEIMEDEIHTGQVVGAFVEVYVKP